VDLRQRAADHYQGCMVSSARELEMVTAVKGGVKQDPKPSWSFTGRLSVPYGNKRGPTVADKSTDVALMCG
jgi:hypothetical protein